MSPNVNIDNFQNPKYVLEYQQKITDTTELNKENKDKLDQGGGALDHLLTP